MIIERRKFLGFMAAAPTAATVVAKSAAAKMGLGADLPGMPVAKSFYGNSECEVACRDDSSYLDHLKKRLKNLLSSDRVEERIRQAKGEARVLDPDLAASRSLSPSAAYQIQVQRCCDRLLEEERNSLTRRISEELKNQMMPV